MLRSRSSKELTCAATVCAGHSTHVLGSEIGLTKLVVVVEYVVGVVVLLLLCLWVCIL